MLTHLSDAELLRQLAALVAEDRANTAILLAHLAEVDARRLYAPAGYPSMHAFCVDHLRYSDDAAFRRIRAARAARRFPALFSALSDGRLHLAAVSLLSPHLTTQNVDTLIAAATHKRKTEIEEWLASRFPLSEALSSTLARVRVIPPPLPHETAVSLSQLGLGEDQDHATQQREGSASPVDFPCELRSDELVLGRVATSELPAAPRFHFQFVVPKSTHEKLCRAQALLSHSLPAGDLAQVFDRALDALISQLEVRRLGVNTREPHREPRPDNGAPSRYIPASVRRAVWERDQGRCTFISITGGRCRSRRFLECDHIVPVARGGKATVENIRLRCSAHNQYEAERAFGVDFMRRKRQEAVAAAAAREVSRAPATDPASGATREGPA
jgi:5-methylcytosine-specific restriction endonuclease McrA